jgi:hypothetical protein
LSSNSDKKSALATSLKERIGQGRSLLSLRWTRAIT